MKKSTIALAFTSALVLLACNGKDSVSAIEKLEQKAKAVCACEDHKCLEPIINKGTGLHVNLKVLEESDRERGKALSEQIADCVMTMSAKNKMGQ